MLLAEVGYERLRMYMPLAKANIHSETSEGGGGRGSSMSASAAK